MPVTAKLNYLRIAPRKVRLVADLIRKKKAEEAQTILDFTKKRSAEPLLKLLKSAIANARHNFQLNPQNLYISKIIVDEGPKYKRWMPRARGIASEIQKKTSHITLVLEEITLGKKIKKAKKIKEKPAFAKASAVGSTKSASGQTKSAGKPKFKPFPAIEKPKPRIERGIKRIFRRKAF